MTIEKPMTIHCDTKKQAEILLRACHELGYEWIYRKEFPNWTYEPDYGYYFSININGRVRHLTKNEGRSYRLLSEIERCNFKFAEFSDLDI